jgi:ketosteroid isomerase-like protein
VLRLGDMVTSKAVREWLAADPAPRQVVVDPEGGWNEPTTRAEQMVRVDPAALCRALVEEVEPDPEPGWLDLWTRLARTTDVVIERFLESLGDELFEPRVYRELGSLLPAGSTVYVASSMPIRDLETFLPTLPQPLVFLSNRGANGIDGLVSSGLGAAAVGGRTYVLIGDLGLYHDMNGLLAVKRCGVDATIVVLNNGGGGIFDFLPIAEHRDGYEELFATPTGLDFEKVASLYGLRFTRLGSYDQLEEALARPGLVEVPLDRRRNVELHRELFARVSEALWDDAAGMNAESPRSITNADVALRALEAYNSRDLSVLTELCDPEVEWFPAMAGGVGVGYRGHSGLREYFRDVSEAWAEFRMESEEVHERNETVLVMFLARGRGKGSGAEVEQHSGVVLGMRDRKIVSARVYLDQAAAREAFRAGG